MFVTSVVPAQCTKGIVKVDDPERRIFAREKSKFSTVAVPREEEATILGTILLIILILLLVGALPTWPYSTGWGYYPSSGLGVIVIILLILVLMGRI